MSRLACLLLTFWTIFHRTLSDCVQGCLRCDQKNNCLVCDASSLYVRVGGNCIQNTLKYCALAYTLNACALCIPGYYLEINRKCAMNTNSQLAVANCYRYASFTRCQQCAKYYYPSTGGKTCAFMSNVVAQCQVYNGPNTCAVCADSVPSSNENYCLPPTISDNSCLFYSNQTVCQTCQPGYWLNENLYLSNIQLTFQGLYSLRMDYTNTFNALTSVQQCTPIPVVPNCVTYNSTTNNCIACASGFYLNQTTLQCNLNPVQTTQVSSIIIPYCYQISSNFVVINGINTQVNTCKLCYQGYYIAVNGYKCAIHTSTVANCAIYSQSTNGQCLLCANGYYMSNTTGGAQGCFERQASTNCLVQDPLSNQCKNCTNPTYILYYNNLYCAPPIQNCLVYNLNSPILSCLACAVTYYYDTTSKQCLINNNYDPYCTLYDSNQVCVLCSTGYYYDSVMKACTADSAEYVARSNCGTFSQSRKDTCVGCNNYYVLMNVNNTCKLPPTTIGPNIVTVMTYCDTYYVNFQGNYLCSKAKVYAPDDVWCDATLPTCLPNSLNLTSGLAISITAAKKSNNCQNYSSTFDTSTPWIPCKGCKPSALVVEWLYTSDVCASQSKIPWCPDATRDPDSKICNFPGQNCSQVYVGAGTNTDAMNYTQYDLVSTCVNCPANSPFVPNCFLICTKYVSYDPSNAFTSITGGNNVACQQTTTQSPYYCDDPAGSPIPNTPCTKFGGTKFACGMSGVYQVAWTYPVQLAPDNSQCVIEDIYYNPNVVCLAIQNFSCLLCIRGYFPVKTLQVPYVQDSIESYYAILVYSNMNNCMMYDYTIGVCTRCDFAASGMRLNTYGVCIPCNTSAYVTDPTQTMCISFFSVSLIYGSCYKVYPNYVPSPCLACGPGYFNIYNFTYDWSTSFTDIDYIASSFQNVTYIGNVVNAYQIQECASQQNIFVNQISLKNQNQFCQWGYSVSGVYYCLACQFGYAGMLNQTSSSVYFLQNCTLNPLCNNDQYYTFNLHPVRYFMSCHVCINTINIPTLYMYNDGPYDAKNVKFLFSNTDSSNGNVPTTFNCVLKSNSLAPACAVQMFANDPILLPNIGNNAWICLSCLPSYAPVTWVQVLNSRFPYYYVSGCSQILNCADSNVTNQCQQCIPNYNLQNNGTQCVRNSVANPELQYCNVIQVINGKTVCSACMNGYKNLQVATNNPLPAYQCLPYVVPNCQYYSIDQCIQSTKKIGVGFSVIIRRTFTGYYINQSNCNNAQSSVSGCLFYINATSCYLCNPGLTVGGPTSNFCYERNDPNCATWDDVNRKCQTCLSNYSYNGVSCVASPPPTLTVPLCQEYSGQYCSKCVPNYTPIVVANGKTSICVSNSLSTLCAVVNTLGIQQDSVLSCTTCMTIAQTQSLLASKQITLNQFDFTLYSDYQNYLSTGNIVYPASVNLPSYTRASLNLQQLGTVYCQRFGGVENCAEFDAADLTHSFVCLACNVTYYYLQNGNCYARTPVPNCVTYSPTNNTCLTYLDTTTASITYSVLDIVVTSTSIPTFGGFKANPNSVLGCTDWSDQLTCVSCNSSMWLYDNLCLTVTTIVPNCVVYSADGICSRCTSGMLLLQNKCLIIYVSNCLDYLSNTKCSRCPQQYPVLSYSGSCVTNINIPNCLIYDTPTLCYKCSPLFTNIKGTCSFGPLILNCINNYSGECRECASGYLMSSDKKSCNVNPNYDRNCLTFTNKYICIVCQERYYIHMGQCVACQTNEVSCYFCDSSNPTVCLLCSPGFFMDQSGNCQIIVGYIPPALILLNQNNALQATVNSRRI